MSEKVEVRRIEYFTEEHAGMMTALVTNSVGGRFESLEVRRGHNFMGANSINGGDFGGMMLFRSVHELDAMITNLQKIRAEVFGNG